MSPQKTKTAGAFDLKNKVWPMSETDAKAMFVKADRALKALGKDYLVSVEDDLVKIGDSFAKAGENAGERTAYLNAIFAIAHDMKGQGTTFGYPLITEVGHSLCRFIESADHEADATLEVVGAHIDSLRVILHGKMLGDSPEGQALVTALGAVVAKVSS